MFRTTPSAKSMPSPPARDTRASSGSRGRVGNPVGQAPMVAPPEFGWARPRVDALRRSSRRPKAPPRPAQRSSSHKDRRAISRRRAVAAARSYVVHQTGSQRDGLMRVLVIDDEESNHRLLQKILLPAGFDVIAASDGLSGLARVAADKPDVVLLDLDMPMLDGMGVLEQLRAEAADLRRQLCEGGSLAAQMGNSLPVREVIEQVQTAAASNFSVLILGETGTGKDLVSQAIHRQRDRRNKPFVAIACGAIPEALLESELFGHEKGSFTGADRRKKGHFQLAEGGTVFLDEIGNVPLGLQAKLLRALESRLGMAVGATDSTPMDVRFLAATNDELQARVKQGQFRADLYFRLAQFTISLPPLRDRVEDIPHLAQRFLEEGSIELKRPVREISAEAMQLLMAHDWSGNVRELRNI